MDCATEDETTSNLTSGLGSWETTSNLTSGLGWAITASLGERIKKAAVHSHSECKICSCFQRERGMRTGTAVLGSGC